MKFGNTFDLVNKTIGGDADDYFVKEYGIPSLTSELGDKGLYTSDSFTVSEKSIAYDIVSQN